MKWNWNGNRIGNTSGEMREKGGVVGDGEGMARKKEQGRKAGIGETKWREREREQG